MFQIYSTGHQIIYVSPGTTTINFGAPPIRRGPLSYNSFRFILHSFHANMSFRIAAKDVRLLPTLIAKPLNPSSKIVDITAKSPEPITQPADEKVSDNAELEKNVGGGDGIDIDA
ncbi:uncharacterized protein EAF01_006204 [Botrytis porri]|uniref:Uncharacterized protein n=1 Tax=Botrytis porri TaxID=87229 RepID=A0A4Z1KWF8_9HELO|nr:uncharacterized protein EAF01_006204 [Botrytis porri]KAF7903155.1 hypothetical protein EAF01_006204 [Botrytis porri]TGO88841.1 hypothetical protein BPOR_0138g00020 [Botrytis porri]